MAWLSHPLTAFLLGLGLGGGLVYCYVTAWLLPSLVRKRLHAKEAAEARRAQKTDAG
jgi:hypothetical protein